MVALVLSRGRVVFLGIFGGGGGWGGGSSSNPRDPVSNHSTGLIKVEDSLPRSLFQAFRKWSASEK